MLTPLFFPKGLTACFTRDVYGTEVLTENERAIVARYGTKRLSDFSTGRYCVRTCLSAFGFAGDILIGERGMPVLPAGFTASISHSRNLCGAIAASTKDFLSVGLDIETIGRVNTELWRLLFTEKEQSLLRNLGEDDQRMAATIFFSLKEAFYKLQFPLTSTFLDFLDVEIRLFNHRYYIETLAPVNHIFPRGRIVAGNVTRNGTDIVTWCVLRPRGGLTSAK